MAPATEGEAIDETTVEIEDEEVPLAGRKNPASAWWMLVMLVLIAGGAYIGTGRTSKRVHMYNH